jgi:hypothetical protein
MEPWARDRVRVDPRWGRALVLVVLVLWVPVGWLVVPAAIGNLHTPFSIAVTDWSARLFQVSLLILSGASVMVLGKRGLCRYFCPFNPVVGRLRRVLRAKHGARMAPTAVQATRLGNACARCTTTGCQLHAHTAVGRRDIELHVVQKEAT